jgi:hypothetical protein
MKSFSVGVWRIFNLARMSKVDAFASGLQAGVDGSEAQCQRAFGRAPSLSDAAPQGGVEVRTGLLDVRVPSIC